ncbi:MAG: type II toxin-antitoxin system VapC family toxin [Deltaproteobacteria bacterium]|nr:type II toxin-antitoxin system VapC family toxin [Deltaproteobacteria bacterium]MBW1817656.1 type II toxin-antitoxin system VapC family toxin [Deltaproteobacteria bacterium]MBW2284451.1 type II toxin-antitoxin system VapC family toxin [Deltaproteobacteria bacterium]
MIVVIDTSAAVEIVLQRSPAGGLNRKVETADWVIAPMLFICEVTNVFWKYHRFKNMPMEECESGIDLCIGLVDTYFKESDLYQEAFQMACMAGRPVYDMYFLVLARRNNARLLTTDRGLTDVAREHAIRVA